MILTDDKHAVMERADLDALPDYSMSIPTGTTIGKRWKRDNNVTRLLNGALPDRERGLNDWWMGEYQPHEDPRYVNIMWLKILVVK